jgi:hypothetical protein
MGSRYIEQLRTRSTAMPVNSIDPLHLEGWDRRSVWGYDEGTQLYFAQLWRNTDNDADPPTFWLGFRPPAEWACQIWDAIVAVTGTDPDDVRRAMGDDPYVDIRPHGLFPAPWDRELIDAVNRLDEPPDPATRCDTPT